MSDMSPYRSGIRRDPPRIIHLLTKPYKTPERQMKGSAGWYTFFAGQWCWVFKRKGMYYATIIGKGDTPRCKTLEEVEDCVRRNRYIKH
jgi:hypothetical protein